MKSKKKILTTNRAGFLDVYLFQAILNQEHHVICPDNFFIGKKENIEALLLPNFQQKLCYA